MTKDMVLAMAEMVERFNREIIGLPIPTEPRRLSPERKKFGTNHMVEEINEFSLSEDIDTEVDALIDLVYVALGRLIEMGVAPMPVFEEVHKMNMMKRRGTLSKRPGSLGHDAIKPEGWTPPDLKPFLTVTQADLIAATSPGVTPDQLGFFASDKMDTRRNPKILVLGFARHGKDTVSEMLRDNHGLSFTSSSAFCAEHVILPALSPVYGYTCAEDCIDDKEGHRAEWYQLIQDYNTPDKTRLAREIFARHDVYCGLRSAVEFLACKDSGIFDVVLWVNRPGTIMEDKSSCSVLPFLADHVIENDGTLEELAEKVDRLMEVILNEQ